MTAAVTANAGDTAAAVLGRLPEGPPSGGAIHVVDQAGRLAGLVSLEALVRHPSQAKLAEVMGPPGPTVTARTDQERVATLALRHQVTSMPVCDGEGRLLGVVPAAALLDILRREHVEDLHRMAGVTRETAHARRAVEAPPVRRAWDRLPWLLVGLAGSALATAVMSGFEGRLRERVALAFFVPGLVYLADAIGTQSEAIVVRGLSTTHQSTLRLLGGELRTGLLIGFLLAVLVWAAVFFAFRSLALASAVAMTVAAAAATASAVGAGLPALLSRWGKDPAFGSGPLGTIIQDVLTLLIYFAAISWLL